MFVLHQNEEGRKEKTKSQITEGLIPFLKAASGGGTGRRERLGAEGGGTNTFHVTCDGGLFLCVNSSTPFNF